MKATAKRRKGYAHSLTARHHTLVADEPERVGGADAGPTPQELLALSLASCTAITIEMYADRKGWDVGTVEVEVDCELDSKGGCSRFDLLLRLPNGLSEEQVERLKEISGRCPVHRTLKGDVEIAERVELV
jgi:putative redox protein